MSEHYTKSTLEATSFCRTCGRPTQHRVSCGRIQECLEHQRSNLTAAQKKQRQKRATRDRQSELFP